MNDQVATSGARELTQEPSAPAGAPQRARRRWLGWPALGVAVVLLLATRGPVPVAQATINGLTDGAYLALGAVGLTLLYGTLHLVNFAHGDMMTAGAYVALVVATKLGVPLALAAVAGIAAVSVIGSATEAVLWRPLRERRAGHLQLLLVGIGLAYVIRNVIQLIAGSDPQILPVNATTTWVLPGGLRIGRVELVVLLVGVGSVLATATFIRYAPLGKKMRAMADNRALAEIAGLDTGRITMLTWLLAGGLAGLAGVLAGSVSGQVTPNFGFQLLLFLFVAVVLGGLGSAYGALAGGIVLGLVQDWSTLFIGPQWKLSVGFCALILVILLRPNGIFGKPALK